MLYLAVGEPRPGYGDDGPDGVILRYADSDNQPSGVTVVGFRQDGWAAKTRELAAIIANHVGVSATEAREIVEKLAA